MTTELQEKRRANQIRLWNDPVYRSNQMLKRSAIKWRKQLAASVSSVVSQPEIRAKWKNSFLQYLHLPGVHESLTAHCRALSSRPEVRKKQSAKSHQLWQSVEYRAKQKQSSNTPEVKVKRSVAQHVLHTQSHIRQHKSAVMKAYWNDQAWIAKYATSVIVHPNKPEQVLTSILDSLFPGRYRFVGNFAFTVGGKNPDFVHA